MKQKTQSEVTVNESSHEKLVSVALKDAAIMRIREEYSCSVLCELPNDNRGEADAHRIITAVNSYDDLLQASILQADYIDYVTDKIGMNEMPFTMEQWKQANIDMAD